jgi:hypothetical protein
MEGYKWAIGDEAGFTAQHQAQRVIKNIDKTFEVFTPREKFEFINTLMSIKQIQYHINYILMKPLFLISCPFDTYSGYGARSRDVVKAIIETINIMLN